MRAMAVVGVLAATLCAGASAQLPRAPLSRPRSLREPGSGFGDGVNWIGPEKLPPFSPPLPKQFPRNYDVQWFEQPVDHFNLLQPVDPKTRKRKTFKQRLLVHNKSYGGAGSPVIFYTGAEGSGVDAIWDHSGWIVEQLASNLSALVVMAEHRFFGASTPFGNSSCELSPRFNASCESSFWPNASHLGVLSEEQSLEDFAMVVHHLRTELDGGWESPFITLGGSLAGEISTWFRIRYPHLVDMALAASAPILGYPGLSDEYGWNRVVTETFRSVCAAEGVPDAVEFIRSGFSELPKLSPAELSSRFKTCTPANKTCDYQVLTEMVANFVGPAAESAYPPSRSPVVSACQTMVGAKNPLQAWTQLLAPGANETCLNVTWKPYCYHADDRESSVHSDVVAEQQQWKEAMRTDYHGSGTLETNGWDYLACTTEVHPIGSNNITDFLPPAPFDQSSVERWCQEMFQTFDLNQPKGQGDPFKDRWTQVWMDANQMPWGIPMPINNLRAQVDLRQFIGGGASRIIWSSGSHDPWSAQSVNHSLSENLLAVIIDGGAHHSDLGGPYNPVADPETDTPSLVAAREFEMATLWTWSQQVTVERRRQATSQPLPPLRF